MTQGSLFFEGRGKVQETLQRIIRKLDELGVSYAIVGGMALFAHGFRRYTEDVDILVTPDGLKRIHEELEGRGYNPPFEKSKHLRDTETKVKIEFLTAGGYPGDGKPKPVAFPDPETVVELHQGIKCVRLTTLIELKLASGLSNEQRGKDLTDVEQMILVLHLPENLVEKLNPYVQRKYRELWQKLRRSEKRYVMACPDSALPSKPTSLQDACEHALAFANKIRAMLADGLELDEEYPSGGGCLYLSTHDRILAEKYGMVPADEIFPPDDDLSTSS